MNTELFIEAAKKKYDAVFNYSKTDYVNARTKLVITCLKHGDFQQRAHSHLEGYGCKRCALEAIANKKVSFLVLGVVASITSIQGLYIVQSFPERTFASNPSTSILRK